MLNIVIALCPCNCYALRESQVLVLLRSGWAHQRRRRGGSDGHGRWVRSASSVLCGEVNIFAGGRTHLFVFDTAGPTAPATTSATSARSPSIIMAGREGGTPACSGILFFKNKLCTKIED